MLENIGQFETNKNELLTIAFNVQRLCDIMLDIALKPLFEADSLEVVIQWFSG